MKKLISLILALSLGISCLCALSEDAGLSGKMAEVTQKVVDALDIGEDYDNFSGNRMEDYWYLNWNGLNGYISVMCDGDGTIYSYDAYEDDLYAYKPKRTFNAHFPTYGVDALKEIADAFRARVITLEGCGWELATVKPTLYTGAYSQATVRGSLLLNDYPTDVSFTLSIDPMKGKVRSFYRSDSYQKYLETEEPDQTKLGQADSLKAQMKQRLLDAYGMEPVYYVVDGSEEARLVYRPTDSGRIAIGFNSGELISFTPSAVNTAAEAFADEAEEDTGFGASSKRALTEVELKGIALYKDALSEEALDGTLRSMPELILKDGDRLAPISYTIENGRPCAYLTYIRELENGETMQMYFHLDALNGRLLSMNSYSDGERRANKTADAETLEQNARAFVEKYYSDYAADTALDNSGLDVRNGKASYSYVRRHNGYSFRANYISVTVDAESGKISDFYLNWNEDQKFFEPGDSELIGIEKAKRILTDDQDAKLMYLSVPESAGARESYSRLTLCWCFDQDRNVYAVDAVSGEAYRYRTGDETVYEYADTESMPYPDEIRTLGMYGIGLKNRLFTADEEAISPRELVVLILQASGYADAEQMEDEQLNRLFGNLYGSSVAQTDTDTLYTRDSAMTVLVWVAGYGEAASLEGIYTYDASDWDSVPDGMKGFLAIAASLGLIELEDGAFDPSGIATPALVAHALYVLLSR